MKQRVADYIADFLADNGITDVFTVVGGGAMHLNDAFGHHPKLHCTYNHHEQACAIAAEGYARYSRNIAAVCVTSGPGAINALNGVVGAYQDSIPMLVLSGQTKTSLTVHNSGLHLRTLGNQEFDIVSALENAVKYSEMITDAEKIRYCMEKALHIAQSGRPGPCWLDIPLDIQGKLIETDKLQGFPQAPETEPSLDEAMTVITEKLAAAKRPVLYAGNGIRIAGAAEEFKRLVRTFKIPVVTCWDSIDLIDTDNPFYCGRAGTMGDRAGNFAVQNSDLLICIGTRLNIYQVGYDIKTWAREAFTVVVDIDGEELKKPTIRVDLPVCCDAGHFIKTLTAQNINMAEKQDWIKQCQQWKLCYSVVTAAQKQEHGLVNVYSFFDKVSRLLPEEAVSVVANGSASVVGSASFYIKKNDRFMMNCGLSSMGYGLPAAIGVCTATKRKTVFCFEGDGSIMMNLQELQTMVTNKLPIKLFIINNAGYHQIRQTQTNVFHNGLIGVGPESKDLGFPNFCKLAEAFDIPYIKLDDNQRQDEALQQVLSSDSFVMCEVFVTTTQKYEPKSSTKRLKDGSLYSPPLEDLAPFLSREELKRNMYIPLIDEK